MARYLNSGEWIGQDGRLHSIHHRPLGDCAPEFIRGEAIQSLKEFNDERWRNWAVLEELRKPHPNGIACPQCGGELWDTRPDCVLVTLPSKKNVHCPLCDFRGYRLV